MISNFGEFILESILMESKLHFSKKFGQLLNLIKGDNTIKNALINLSKTESDAPISQNYIDISPNKDEVTFIQDRRAQQILSEGSKKYKTNDSADQRFLTFNKDNKGRYNNRNAFAALGFTPTEPTNINHPVPRSGVEGEVLSEYTNQSGVKYLLFEWRDSNNTPHKICLNSTAIDMVDDSVEKLYTQSRNPIRIGRLVQSIMSTLGRNVPQKEVEEFVNLYKSAYDMANNALIKFDIVDSSYISKWYDYNTYHSMKSTLGNSCMAGEGCSEFFGIYTDNPDVCRMVILYDDNGQIDSNGKYKSKKIKGRALVWRTNEGKTIMDRIYTNYDSDVELFIQFADKNGWYHKWEQDSDNEFRPVINGNRHSYENFTISLKFADHRYYPYMDTFKYLRVDSGGSGVLSNDNNIRATRQLYETDGGYNTIW